MLTPDMLERRAEYIDGREVRDGRIIEPGKFEGEMVYVPYFYEMYLDGFADEDEDDDGTLVFAVTDDDRAMWPEIPADQPLVRLWIRDDGFVCEI